MNSFNKTYNETKTLFNKELEKKINSFDYYPILNDAIKYSLQAGGKRLRPVLMLETAKLLDMDINRVINLAIALEMIHTYSLIHDDLPAMDDDDLRRGMPTNHIKFGEANAILAGDGLLNLAIEIALDSIEEDNAINYVKAIKHLFKASGASGMIGGQVIDIKKTGKFQSIEDLKKMHSLKTGALFNAACLCPALILDCDDNIINSLNEYSKHFGLLFQITDDILDVVGNKKDLGKSVGKDLFSDKSTYVNLLGIEQAKNSSLDAAEQAKNSLNIFEYKADFHKNIINFVLERKN